MKEFSRSSNIKKGWKGYQGVVNNTYHGRNIETDNHIILSIQGDVTNMFLFPKFTASWPRMLREVIGNGTTEIYEIYLNGLEVKRGKSISVYEIMKTGMEVVED